MSLPENREVTAAHTKGKERSEGHRKKYCRKSNVGNGRIGAGKRGITDDSKVFILSNNWIDRVSTKTSDQSGLDKRISIWF